MTSLSEVNLTELRAEDALVVELAGFVDSANAAGVQQRLMAVVARGDCNIVLDLDQLEYMSSAGFRILLLLSRAVGGAGGKLAICGLRGRIRSLFELGGFLDLLPVFPSKNDAIAWFHGTAR